MAKPKLMIIDDSALSLAMLREELKLAGFDVVCRAQPIGSGAAIHREQPDLVLVDLLMPHLQGPDLISLIRKNPLISHSKLLLYSDRPEQELRIAAASCGADGFIRTGLDAQDLALQLHNWLQKDTAGETTHYDPLLQNEDVVVFVDDDLTLRVYRSTFCELPASAYLSSSWEAYNMLISGHPPACIIVGLTRSRTDMSAEELYRRAIALDTRWQTRIAVALDRFAVLPPWVKKSPGPAIVSRPVDWDALRMFLINI